MDFEGLVTFDEACRALRISKATLYRRVQDGVLPVHKLGRRTLFSPSDLAAYVASCRSQKQDERGGS